MNKQQLIDSMSTETGMTKEKTKQVLNAMIKVGANALKKGERVTISNVGSFYVSTRAARTGRNPQTGKSITIKPKKVVKFKPNCPPPR